MLNELAKAELSLQKSLENEFYQFLYPKYTDEFHEIEDYTQPLTKLDNIYNLSVYNIFTQQQLVYFVEVNKKYGEFYGVLVNEVRQDLANNLRSHLDTIKILSEKDIVLNTNFKVKIHHSMSPPSIAVNFQVNFKFSS